MLPALLYTQTDAVLLHTQTDAVLSRASVYIQRERQIFCITHILKFTIYMYCFQDISSTIIPRFAQRIVSPSPAPALTHLSLYHRVDYSTLSYSVRGNSRYVLLHSVQMV